jgi:hypothetical protein
MSRFGDLIRGKSAPAPAPVVEEAPAPAPVVKKAPAPVAKKKKKDRREEVEQEWKEATDS